MDSNLIAISAHSIERIVAVLLGGLAVYYGFRLFMVVPFETQGDGKIQVPGVSVVLVKAGPGLFFAAFGATVIITSLLRPIKVGSFEGEKGTDYSGFTGAGRTTGETRPSEVQAQSRDWERDVAGVRLDLQTLNCMQHLSTAGSRGLSANDSELAVRHAKLALLKSVWVESKFGDFEEFRRWAAGGTSSTASPAKALFEAERTDCPR